MKLDRIQIRTTDAKLELNITKPVQHIEQPNAKQTIHQPAATLEMSHRDAKLYIDSTQAYRDVGIISTKEMISNFAQAGQQAAMEGTARRAAEGNAMMDIEKSRGRAVLANLARQHDTYEVQRLGITWKPSIGSVKIRYEAGDLNIKFTEHKPQIDVQTAKPIHEYIPGKVTSTLVQKPSVETTVIKGE